MSATTGIVGNLDKPGRAPPPRSTIKTDPLELAFSQEVKRLLGIYLLIYELL